MPDAYEHVRRFPLNVVLAHLGFETFKYRKSGTEGYGACPIHGSKKNTTCFSFNDEGLWRCFSCPAKGKGAIDLVKAIRKCGFQEAVETLKGIDLGSAVIAGAREPRIATLQVPPTENPPFKATYDKYAVPSAWLKERGLTEDKLKRFEVFEYNNPARRSVYSGSVLLKIRRWCDGECVGYLSRNIGEITADKPKYLFPKGVQKSLEVFGAFQLKEKTPLRVLWVLESPFAVMKFYQHGFEAVSCFGWSISDQQASILQQLARGVVFLPDRNKYSEATSVAGELARRLWVKMPELPPGVEDPEQLSADQIRSLSGQT